MLRLSALCLLTVLVAAPPALAQYQVHMPTGPAPHVPIVHSADLFYPAWDWDDVADVTSYYALDAGGMADVKLFVMNSPSGSRGDGATWQGPFRVATGKDIEHTTGTSRIIDILNAAQDHSVVLTAGGGLQDIANAYTANPALFVQKVKRMYTSGGGGYGRTIGNDANWGTNVSATRTVLTTIVAAGVPLYVGFCGGDVSRRDATAYLMDIPARMAVTDPVNPDLSTITYWAYYTATDGGFRYKHQRLDEERYAQFGLPQIKPSYWANIANRPPLPANITQANVKADPNVFFAEPQNQSYSRESFTLTVSTELRNPPAGSDGSISPFGIKGMWSTINFLDAAGLRIFRNGNDIQLSYADSLSGYQRVCFFEPENFSISSTDVFTYIDTDEAHANIHIFRWDSAQAQADYQAIIGAVDNALIANYLPEPATLLLLMGGAAAIVRRRRVRHSHAS